MSRHGPMPRTRRRGAKNVIAALHAAHWAIRQDALHQMMEIASRENVIPEALQAKLGQPANDDDSMTVRDGVATIAVSGPLFRYANIFTQISGATAYAMLATDLQQALDTPQVKSIILEIDSPGGEVNGAAELADMIYAARGQKPIVAYISGDGCSAAYWLASAADEIVIAQTAIVGCIGAVASLVDTTAADEMMGVRRIEIVSSQTPKKRPPVMSGEAQAQVQTLVDDLSQVFIEAVARNRGVGVDVVLSDFGEGGVFVGEAAIAPGLADRLGSYESLHAELASGSYTTSRATAARATTLREESSMKLDSTAVSATAGSAESETLATSAVAIAAACTCGHAEGQHEGATGPCTCQGCDCQKYTAAACTCGCASCVGGSCADCTCTGCTCQGCTCAAAVPAQASTTPAAAPDSAADPSSGSIEPPSGPSAESVQRIAVLDERERVEAIESLGRPGQERLVAECVLDPKCTPGMAALKLLRAESAARAVQLRSLAGDDDKLNKPGPIAPDATDQHGTGAAVRRILAAHEKVTIPNRS